MDRARGLTTVFSKKALAGTAEKPSVARITKYVSFRIIAHPL
jgi:hypothetical protein